MFLLLHPSKIPRIFESMEAFSETNSSFLIADNAGIVGPGKSRGGSTLSPQDLKPAVKAWQCCLRLLMSIAAAAPTLRIVQSEKLAGFDDFFWLMFQDPSIGLAVVFPEYKNFGAVSTRPGTAIILGSTSIPKAAYKNLSVYKVRQLAIVKTKRDLPDYHT